MITAEQIKMYKKFKGDGDGFARAGATKDKSILGDHDWNLIDNMIQDLSLINKGLCSKNYETRCMELLHKKFDKEAIEFLMPMK